MLQVDVPQVVVLQIVVLQAFALQFAVLQVVVLQVVALQFQVVVLQAWPGNYSRFWGIRRGLPEQVPPWALTGCSGRAQGVLRGYSGLLTPAVHLRSEPEESPGLAPYFFATLLFIELIHHLAKSSFVLSASTGLVPGLFRACRSGIIQIC